ncbi:hypothetical protein LOZ65_003957 [Ophidiomyces ophidiicola]|nr:hypothetical protein LOZ65_003957 [Ophidiomyces ophidiicola]
MGDQGSLPLNSWDSHMHIVDPIKYPLSQDAQYTPSTHTLAKAMEFESSFGISNIVLVQPSIYGFDNSCLLDGLRELGSQHGRAVVTIDPQNIQQEILSEWHQLGVRGVRLNLQSTGRQISTEALAACVRQHADIIRPFNWVLQLYISLSSVKALLDVVPNLGVRVCLDHFSSPALPQGAETTAFDPYSLSGFTDLVSLLNRGNTYVKISAPYRLSTDPHFEFLGIIAKELMRIAPDRLVFATDWPHTRFEGLDISPFVKMCLDWCGGDGILTRKLFQQNAEELWDARKER